MDRLPEAAERALTKGIAAYLRATNATELPPGLAALKKTVQTPKSLARHRDRLLAVLDDDALRALVLEWLEEGKPPLSRSEIATLKLAAERPEGWTDRLAALEKPKAAPKKATGGDAEVRELMAKLEREKEAHRKAREEVKRVKESGRVATKAERDRSLRLDEEVTALRSAIHERDADLREARTAAERAQKEIERLKRKSRSDVDRLKEQQRKLREQNRELKQKLQDAERAASEQRKAAAVPKKAAAKEAPSGPRPVLDVPKGRLEDAPETLEQWMATAEVTLVVDGYNVTHSATGFSNLGLEQQRTRLRDVLKKLSNRTKVPTVLVWDGGVVAPGTKRRSSGYLTEEYSAPDRSGKGTEKDRADRHIVELLKKMPPHPVVVVTNDRGLQDEARAERATIATSDQLLSLAR